MTTHEDRQLGRKIMKPMKGPLIPGNEGMPKYATRGGQELDQKVNETYGRSNALGKGGYAPICNSNGSTTRSKVSEAYGRFDDLGEGGYAPVCNSRGRQLDQK